ncbi:14446_t:CDS:2 [Funneliformis geosporum]|uniref:18761_t:CDS:1 n=1 Tax=Funneliformis geosporum TaxID=1117311 RepID=A0A9W4SHI0_9GLOM|nr:14446_t:CDS:2 [Funneliformis geosporum]CAI2169651.1 18761_t:CDS:2 [Funneliformis geosporum]
MSNHRLLTFEELNEKLSSNKQSFPIDPAIKEIFKRDDQSLDDLVQWIKEEKDNVVDTTSKGSDEDHVKWSLNRELLQTLKSSLEQITKFGKESDIKEFLSKFNNLIRLPHLHKYFEELNISQIDDKFLEILCNDIVQCEDITYQNFVVFFKFTFLEKVRLITSKPSRELLSILSKIAKVKSKPIIYGLLLPLIQEPQEIARPQLEVITRTINGGLSEDSIVSLITELSSDVQMLSELMDETLPKHLKNWDDSMIEILFSIFSQKFRIEDPNIFKRFLYHLRVNIELRPNNQKLGQILLLLVTKHSESIMDHLEEVKVAAEKSTAFMKKSVLGKIDSLIKRRVSPK